MRSPFPPFAWKTLRRALDRRRARSRPLGRALDAPLPADARALEDARAGTRRDAVRLALRRRAAARLLRKRRRATGRAAGEGLPPCDGRRSLRRSAVRGARSRRRAGLLRASGEAREPGDGRGRAGARRPRSGRRPGERTVRRAPAARRTRRARRRGGASAASLAQGRPRRRGAARAGALPRRDRGRRRPRRANALRERPGRGSRLARVARPAGWTRHLRRRSAGSHEDGGGRDAPRPRFGRRACPRGRRDAPGDGRPREAASPRRGSRCAGREPRRGMARGSGAGRGDPRPHGPRRHPAAAGARRLRGLERSGALAVALGAGGRGPRRRRAGGALARVRRRSRRAPVGAVDAPRGGRARRPARACACRTGPHRRPALRSPSPRRRYITAIPEVALTALAVEALSRHPAPWSRAAATRARAFIARTQLVGDRVYGALDPSLAWGAFPVSPVADWLRGDVTAHAVLALAPSTRATSSPR